VYVVEKERREEEREYTLKRIVLQLVLVEDIAVDVVASRVKTKLITAGSAVAAIDALATVAAVASIAVVVVVVSAILKVSNILH
jgi:hypothetical protein